MPSSKTPGLAAPGALPGSGKGVPTTRVSGTGAQKTGTGSGAKPTTSTRTGAATGTTPAGAPTTSTPTTSTGTQGGAKSKGGSALEKLAEEYARRHGQAAGAPAR
ncbi:MAG TPA: hypothetical protein VNY52_09925 [Solirubrobacteraceae bacterium]|nr:hypothetical protein [Solirubrobacteraceae bacterium]